ncbi:MAG: hypothetical protein AB7D39_07195 [Pseudodesulfovibrio sp.]|uniref:hypothetical protein n=1 Tax=Pseudodesulfovibrio sp. TaxID=2035812 RepID=UPI003D0E3446
MASSISHAPLFLFSGLYFVICYLSLATWAAMGTRVGAVLDTRKKMQRFNLVMGSLLGLCALYLLLTSLGA